jgi:hypothetical protein
MKAEKSKAIPEDLGFAGKSLDNSPENCSRVMNRANPKSLLENNYVRSIVSYCIR